MDPAWETLKAPFPYFGGKSKVAPIVWERFGDVPNYVEPFFGSGAMLLARPHDPGTETVNDKDGFVANFWRAVQHDPEAVAHDVHRWCLEHGQSPLLRIALCGYEGEGHDALERVGWSMVKWKTSGGYASQDSVGKVNAKRERIWFSPACVKPAPTLFEDKP